MIFINIFILLSLNYTVLNKVVSYNIQKLYHIHINQDSPFLNYLLIKPNPQATLKVYLQNKDINNIDHQFQQLSALQNKLQAKQKSLTLQNRVIQNKIKKLEKLKKILNKKLTEKQIKLHNTQYQQQNQQSINPKSQKNDNHQSQHNYQTKLSQQTYKQNQLKQQYHTGVQQSTINHKNIYQPNQIIYNITYNVILKPNSQKNGSVGLNINESEKKMIYKQINSISKKLRNFPNLQNLDGSKNIAINNGDRNNLGQGNQKIIKNQQQKKLNPKFKEI